MTEDEAWASLNAALQEHTPLCDGIELFTADRLSDDERDLCERICAGCDVLGLCDAYAVTAKVDFGFWAGRSYSPKRNRITSTTDVEAASSAPINRRNTP